MPETHGSQHTAGRRMLFDHLDVESAPGLRPRQVLTIRRRLRRWKPCPRSYRLTLGDALGFHVIALLERLAHRKGLAGEDAFRHNGPEKAVLRDGGKEKTVFPAEDRARTESSPPRYSRFARHGVPEEGDPAYSEETRRQAVCGMMDHRDTWRS